MTESGDNITILIQSEPIGLAREENLTNLPNAASSLVEDDLKSEDRRKLIMPDNSSLVPAQPRPIDLAITKNKLSPPTTASVKPSSSAADQNKKTLSTHTKPKKGQAKFKKRKLSKKQRKLLTWAIKEQAKIKAKNLLAPPMVTRSKKNEGHYDLWLRPALKNCCITVRDASHIKNILEGTVLHGSHRFSPRIISVVSIGESYIRIKCENYDTYQWLDENASKISGPWLGHSGYVVTTEPTIPIIKSKVLKSHDSVLPASSGGASS